MRNLKVSYQLSPRSLVIWRIAQAIVWLAGIIILFCLLFFPAIGILLFWNILIPVAPALLVISTGFWRNVCPLATTNLLPRHFGLSKKKKLTAKQLGLFSFIAVVALYIIVPLRHALFNTSGPATAALIISMVITGLILGSFYEWKSAWCSGLCPIHPVEKLYGGNIFARLPNAHCSECANCVAPCPDSTANIHPRASKKNLWFRMSGFLTTGGLPGFIWGWFQVPDKTFADSLNQLVLTYEWPFLGLAVSLAIYGLLSVNTEPKYEQKLSGFFAATGVSCYYWHRIPALFGFGHLGADGLLIDLKGKFPAWGINLIIIAMTAFFFYQLFIRDKIKKVGSSGRHL